MKFDTLTLFLNRACPRGCPQCGLQKSGVKRRNMRLEEWKEAINLFREHYGTKFLLILGTEPLFLREDLVRLVRWFADEEIFYAMYTTSPEPLFSQYRQALVDAGLSNWSSGVDLIPGMYETDPVTERKARESIEGLRWMKAKGVRTVFSNTTIHRKNLQHLPHILEWCQTQIPCDMSTLNFIEWRRNPRLDFFSPREEMQDLLWEGTEEEKKELRKVMRQVMLLSLTEGMKIEVSLAYLLQAPHYYDNLRHHCSGVVGPAIDCDGTLRLCGYSQLGGAPMRVEELKTVKGRAKFERLREVSLEDCPGCHWVFTDMLIEDFRILDPWSGYYEERWVISRDRYHELLRGMESSESQGA